MIKREVPLIPYHGNDNICTAKDKHAIYHAYNNNM